MEIYVGYSTLIMHFESAFKEPLFILYTASVIFDIVLGNVKAWTINDVASDIGVKGTLKHLGVFSFVVLLLPPLSYYLGNNGVSLAVLSYLVYQYIISIVENLGQLGFDVPTVFKQKLRQLNDENEKEE